MFKNTENTAYAGSVIAGIWGGLTWGDIGAILGMLLGLATFLMSWYYKRKADRRADIALKYQIKLRENDENG